jgi:ABC-2 type transport system ATP-binding protein
MLISTHILSEVMSVADRVILINNGRLVFDGKPAELIAGSSPEDAFYRLTRGAAQDAASQAAMVARP